MRRFTILICALCLLVSFQAVAQDSTMAPAVQISFDDQPAEAGQIDSGGFALDPRGQRVAVRNRANEVVIWDTDGNLLDVFSIPGADGLPDTVLDTAFNADGSLLAVLASDGAGYSVGVRAIDGEITVVTPFPAAPDVPLRLWFDADLPYLWLEVSPAEPGRAGYVMRLAYGLPEQGGDVLNRLVVTGGPGADPDAFARFGRIQPPLAITSSAEGLIKLWNLQTGEVAAQVQVDGLPVFGGLSADNRHLAWRDPESTALHLLDFVMGDDRIVAALDGEYINYILVTPDASQILGVHVGDLAQVIVWDSTTGERTDLGPYRECTRTPDMARLSRDGNTLVIGCDTGLDIWRVS